MKLLAAVVLSALGLIVLTAGTDEGAQARDAGQTVGKEAVWNPGPKFMEEFREKCGSFTGAQFSECFSSSMERAGASPQALAFTRSTGNIAYLRDFRELGRVDVAYVRYPFRANENDGWFLVNGDPPVVDVDDPKYQPKGGLQGDRQYLSLVKAFPRVSLWPGPRSGTDYPLLQKLAGNGQRFVVRYRLLDGCHACERLGNAWFAFDFDRAGKFMGVRFLGMDRDTRGDPETMEPKSVQNDYTDPRKTIEVAVGREFTIVLGANRTTGYRWDLARPLDRGKVELVRNEYKIEQDGEKVGAGGKEVWTFKAIGEGKTKIALKYVRPWEKNTAGVKTVTFEIDVKK
jgi:predicted secreted protein